MLRLYARFSGACALEALRTGPDRQRQRAVPVWGIQSDGSGIRQLTHGNSVLNDPVPSHDGRRWYFTSAAIESEIWTMRFSR